MNWDDPSYWEDQRKKLFSAIYPIIYSAAQDAAERSLLELPGFGMSYRKASDPTWELMNRHVYDWARSYVFNLVTGIDQYTREYLRKALSDWAASGGKLQDLVDLLKPVFGDYRAWSIAVTEITRAFAEANVLAWIESGVVTGKKWMTAQDELVCEICGPLDGKIVELESNGFSDIDDIGLYSPPAHVNCRCYLQPWIGKIPKSILIPLIAAKILAYKDNGNER